METLTSAESIKDIVKDCNLQHVAIIMDGNRRWAKLHNYPSAVGHKQGVSALKKTVQACDDFGIKYLTVYAFSTENWNRKQEEVDFLMDLFVQTLKNESKELHEKNVVIDFIGDLTKLKPALQDVLNYSKNLTKDNSGVHLQIPLNYDGRDEIVHAVKKIIKSGIDVENITEDTISNNLYTAGMPNPDLLIRTGGEKRISNYLLWQCAYSEIYVTQTFWPEFDKQALEDAIMEFHSRQRRFGA